MAEKDYSWHDNKVMLQVACRQRGLEIKILMDGTSGRRKTSLQLYDTTTTQKAIGWFELNSKNSGNRRLSTTCSIVGL